MKRFITSALLVLFVELTSDGKKTCTTARVFSDIEIMNNLKHPYTFVYLD